MRNGFFKVRSEWETYDVIVRFEFVRLALEMFWTESFDVDECLVGAFDALDEDLHPNITHLCVLLPYLSILGDSRPPSQNNQHSSRVQLTSDVSGQTGRWDSGYCPIFLVLA